MEDSETMLVVRTSLRDDLKVIAAVERKTLKALVEEICEKYINSKRGK